MTSAYMTHSDGRARRMTAVRVGAQPVSMRQAEQHRSVCPVYMTGSAESMPADPLAYLAARVIQMAIIDASGRRVLKVTAAELAEAAEFVGGDEYAELWCAVAGVPVELLPYGRAVEVEQ